jgi:hypothetical protein
LIWFIWKACSSISNKVPKCEAYLTDLAIAHEIITMHWKIEDAQRYENRYTRGLTTLVSQVINQSIDAPITDLLRKEFEEFSSYHEDRRTPLKAKFKSP